MKRFFHLISPLLGVVVFGQLATASTIFSNLGDGQEAYSVIVGTAAAGGYYDAQYALEVIPTATALAGTVDFAAYSNGTSNEMTIEITSDASGIPGAVLASQTMYGSVEPYGSGLTTVVFSNPATLNAGTPYWVVFSGPNLGNLEYYLLPSTDSIPSYSATGALDEYSSGSWFALTGTGSAPSFDLTTDTGVPEPGTFTSGSLALSCLIGLIWRRRRQTA